MLIQILVYYSMVCKPVKGNYMFGINDQIFIQWMFLNAILYVFFMKIQFIVQL